MAASGAQLSRSADRKGGSARPYSAFRTEGERTERRTERPLVDVTRATRNGISEGAGPGQELALVSRL
jgi:hypothetical protein